MHFNTSFMIAFKESNGRRLKILDFIVVNIQKSSNFLQKMQLLVFGYIQLFTNLLRTDNETKNVKTVYN